MNAQPKPEQWPATATPSIPLVYRAIANVMAAIGRTGISKDRKNTQQGYAFRGIDDVYNALSGLLSANGLSILPRVIDRHVTERATKDGKGTLFYVVLNMEFDLCCAEDGSRHTIAVAGEAMDSGDKATNKAMSAAFKYACMQVFCIPTEGNPDADSETHEVAPKSDEIKGESISLDVARAEATRMRGILEMDVEHRIKALKSLDFHEVIVKNPDLYEAASREMSTKERADWKAYVKEAKEMEKDDRKVSNVGRRF